MKENAAELKLISGLKREAAASARRAAEADRAQRAAHVEKVRQAAMQAAVHDVHADGFTDGSIRRPARNPAITCMRVDLPAHRFDLSCVLTCNGAASWQPRSAISSPCSACKYTSCYCSAEGLRPLCMHAPCPLLLSALDACIVCHACRARHLHLPDARSFKCWES